MQYLILIYAPPEAVPDWSSACADPGPEWVAYGEMLRERGAYVSAAPLAPPTSATTLRMSEGKKVVLDGPFAETKEWLGGFYLVEAATLDEALEYAGQCPGLHAGSIEVRPIVAFG